MPDLKKLTILDHLEELRTCLFVCLLYLAIGTGIGFFISSYFFELLKAPLKNSVDNLILLKPTEAVVVYFKIALFLGAIISSPGIFHQVWKFVKPGLPENISSSFTVWLVPIITLFLAGIVFTYFVILPAGLTFLVNLSKKIANPMFTLDSYISFILSIILLGGVVFEMPVLSAFLAQAGILRSSFMKRKRKEAFFGLLVIAAVITPTTDIFNMMLFALPMLALYEISILAVVFIEKTKKRLLINPAISDYVD
ncbi:MAG: twin-arginine translocase subunit TatC [Elusimicrobia bacterium]|nr:twin-arginine translocase subunit TatC [Candidatus Liberimonas magnetica]